MGLLCAVKHLPKSSQQLTAKQPFKVYSLSNIQVFRVNVLLQILNLSVKIRFSKRCCFLLVVSIQGELCKRSCSRPTEKTWCQCQGLCNFRCSQSFLKHWPFDRITHRIVLVLIKIKVVVVLKQILGRSVLHQNVCGSECNSV